MGCSERGLLVAGDVNRDGIEGITAFSPKAAYVKGNGPSSGVKVAIAHPTRAIATIPQIDTGDAGTLGSHWRWRGIIRCKKDFDALCCSR